MQPGTPPPTEPKETPKPQADPAQSSSGTPTGQPSPAAAAQPAGPTKIAPGSVIPVQLSKTIDAKKLKTGDEVVATVTMDMKTKTGEVLVPKDTQVIGHVTQSQARSKEQKESELGIAFDHAVVKGTPMQLPMSIQAIVGPQPSTPNGAAGGEDQNGPATSGTSPAPGPSGAGGTRSGGASGGSAAPEANNAPQGGGSPAPAASNSRPPINGSTQGVIGLSNLKLETTAQNPGQGSLVTSEKNNVKIEKGTLILLRVNP
jgi:hypothetical protein